MIKKCNLTLTYKNEKEAFLTLRRETTKIKAKEMYTEVKNFFDMLYKSMFIITMDLYNKE